MQKWYYNTKMRGMTVWRLILDFKPRHMNPRFQGCILGPGHRGSGTLPYLTQPPSEHQTLKDTSSEKEKLKLQLHHTLSNRFIIK